jgi:ABC-type uncharacterized transport system substrate-binding protein
MSLLRRVPPPGPREKPSGWPARRFPKTVLQRLSRQTVCLLLPLAIVMSGCASRSPTAVPAAPVPLVDPPRRAGRPLVMIAMPDSASFHTVRKTLVDELADDFDVATDIIQPTTTAEQLRARLETSGAAVVVLMDNPTIKLYRAAQAASTPGQAPVPPAVAVMASFLEEASARLPNVSGVAYEVPAVTAFVNLRSLIDRPIRRVGVVHRPVFERFMERQTSLAAREQIELVPIEVSAKPRAEEVRAALRRLRRSENIDALWVLNDNQLLRNGAFLASAWRPEVAAMGVPVIVGIPALVGHEAQFGTFAVVPDLEALGVQAANLVYDVAENGWKATGIAVEPPISTMTIGNMRELRQRFGLREDGARRIDRRVE